MFTKSAITPQQDVLSDVLYVNASVMRSQCGIWYYWSDEQWSGSNSFNLPSLISPEKRACKVVISYSSPGTPNWQTVSKFNSLELLDWQMLRFTSIALLPWLSAVDMAYSARNVKAEHCARPQIMRQSGEMFWPHCLRVGYVRGPWLEWR